MNSRTPSLIRLGTCILAAIVMAFVVPPMAAQNAPIQRIFHPKTSASYHVRLSLRSEVEGQRAETIAAVTYAVPFHRAAESHLEWNVERTVLAVNAAGEAQVQESLADFTIATSPAPPTNDAGPQDQQTTELADALQRTITPWAATRAITYRESPSGRLLDLARDGAPTLGEYGVPLLTMWLLHALRPGIALPAQPLRIGDRWQEPRALTVVNWRDVSAAETGEWLDAQQHPESAARLHIVQQISGQAPSPRAARDEATTGDAAEQLESQVNFHAESLNTISLQDGRLLAATRSGVHEVTRVLPPVPGLPQPPRFRATLSVQVEIEGCDDRSCAPSGASSGGAHP